MEQDKKLHKNKLGMWLKYIYCKMSLEKGTIG